MNWDAIAAIGEILGALAVLFSLLYLARQIHFSTLESQATRRDSMDRLNIDILMRIGADPEMVALLRRGQLDPDSLNGDETMRFDIMLFSIFESWELNYSQWQRGSLSDEDWEAWDFRISGYVGQPGTQSFWKRSGGQFSKSFREYFESLNPEDAYDWGEL